MHNSSDKQPFQKKVEFATHYTVHSHEEVVVIFSRSHEVPKYFIQEVFSSLVCMGACQNWNRSWEERGGDTSELEESGH